MFDRKIDAIRERTEVIVLPEMFSTRFVHAARAAGGNDGWQRGTVDEAQVPQKNVILTGSLIIEEGARILTG